ncbi:MAG: hypothetical protein A2138_25315 [Deltaproteobacteria bacterium RBG_16_71_12]|nr:MAG: hypothetical protein A2138_25315 [Deltaproteobacteria bacterium RBG_16_71_12]
MAEKKKDQKTATLYDKRVIERAVAKGALSKAEVDAHMKALPDLADQADNIADKVYGERK